MISDYVTSTMSLDVWHWMEYSAPMVIGMVRIVARWEG